MTGSFVLFFNILFFQGANELNDIQCESASRTYLFICLTIAALSAISGVGLKWYLDRGHRLGTPVFRLWLTLALAFAISSIIIAWEPGIITSDFLKDCRDSAEFSRYVVMANASKLSKGMVLGGAPSLLVYFIALFGMSILAKSRKR
jgi:ATP/ADP translocase